MISNDHVEDALKAVIKLRHLRHQPSHAWPRPGKYGKLIPPKKPTSATRCRCAVLGFPTQRRRRRRLLSSKSLGLRTSMIKSFTSKFPCSFRALVECEPGECSCHDSRSVSLPAHANPSVKQRKVVLAAIQNMQRKQTEVWPRLRRSSNTETLLPYHKHRRDPKRILKGDALQSYVYESKRIHLNCTTIHDYKTIIIDNVDAHALPRNWCLRPFTTALNLINLIWHGKNTEFAVCDLSFAASTIPNLFPKLLPSFLVVSHAQLDSMRRQKKPPCLSLQLAVTVVEGPAAQRCAGCAHLKCSTPSFVKVKQ